MKFKRIDLTTEVKRKDRKKYIIAGEVVSSAKVKTFKKVFSISEDVRVLPEISDGTIVVVRKNGAAFDKWTVATLPQFGIVLRPGKYSMEVQRG